MQFEFHTLDVFTAEPLGGNPLAVVLGADGLGDQRMQQVAREFNLSETVFVAGLQQASRDMIPVRIFTPRNELSFAGHPVIGTAVLLAELQHKDACPFETRLTLATKAGPVPLTVTRTGGAARASPMQRWRRRSGSHLTRSAVAGTGRARSRGRRPFSRFR